MKIWIYITIFAGLIILFVYLYKQKKLADQTAQFNSIVASQNQQISSISGQQNGLIGLAGVFSGTDLLGGVLGGGKGGSSSNQSGSGSSSNSGGSGSSLSWLALL
jgi:uncharacterized membrane protein YgcG